MINFYIFTLSRGTFMDSKVSCTNKCCYILTMDQLSIFIWKRVAYSAITKSNRHPSLWTWSLLATFSSLFWFAALNITELLNWIITPNWQETIKSVAALVRCEKACSYTHYWWVELISRLPCFTLQMVDGYKSSLFWLKNEHCQLCRVSIDCIIKSSTMYYCSDVQYMFVQCQ